MTNMMHAQQIRPATSTQVQIMPAYIQPTQTVPSVNLTATAPATASAVKMPTSTGGLPAKVTIVPSTPMPTASTVSSAGQTATIAGLAVPAAKRMVHIAPNGLNGLLAAYTSSTLNACSLEHVAFCGITERTKFRLCTMCSLIRKSCRHFPYSNNASRCWLQRNQHDIRMSGAAGARHAGTQRPNEWCASHTYGSSRERSLQAETKGW